MLTLWGNGRNPHSAPLLGREAKGDLSIEVSPDEDHGRSYPMYHMEVRTDHAIWWTDGGEGFDHHWTAEPPLYHVVASPQGIKRLA